MIAWIISYRRYNLLLNYSEESQEKYLNKHLTVGNGKPYDYADSIWENTPIIGFFAPDENGMYKSIAFATVENVENKSKEIPFKKNGFRS